jgi:hypothetical protein
MYNVVRTPRPRFGEPRGILTWFSFHDQASFEATHNPETTLVVASGYENASEAESMNGSVLSAEECRELCCREVGRERVISQLTQLAGFFEKPAAPQLLAASLSTIAGLSLYEGPG